MKKGIVILLCYIGISGFASAEALLAEGTVPPFNPGYLGKKQAFSVQGVSNFAGFFRDTMRYQNNVAFFYEISRKSSLSYQFGYKTYKRTLNNVDWRDYSMQVVEPGSGWSGDQFYMPSGTMKFNYSEFTLGVKNYLRATGATAPFGGYLLANVNFGIANCLSNNLHWENYYSSSTFDTLNRVGNSGVAASIISVAYGFGARNMITDQLGIGFEVTSGLTLMNSAGVKLFVVDSYSDGYDVSTQQALMTSVMLREINKSQWIQFKVGLSYLF